MLGFANSILSVCQFPSLQVRFWLCGTSFLYEMRFGYSLKSLTNHSRSLISSLVRLSVHSFCNCSLVHITAIRTAA